MNLKQVKALGFDSSKRNGNHISVRCSQCEAVVINGVACHERGCPHAVHECKGCNAQVSRYGAYCEDCR